MLERMLSKGNTSQVLVEMQTCTTTLEINMMVSQKIENQPNSGPTLGHIPKVCSIILQGHLFNYVCSSFICNSHNLETTQKPLNQRMDKEILHIYTLKYYSAIKNNHILDFACQWMELENTILSEVNQTPKDEYVCTQS